MENSVDPDQLASEEASLSRSTLFTKENVLRFSETSVDTNTSPCTVCSPSLSVVECSICLVIR